MLSSIGILIVPVYSIYSSGSWNYFKNGCSRAYYAVYLKLGLKVNKCWSKSNAYGSTLPKKEVKDFFFPMFIWFKHSRAMRDWIDYISSLLGLPVNSKIRSIWFRVEVPGKIALPVYI